MGCVKKCGVGWRAWDVSCQVWHCVIARWYKRPIRFRERHRFADVKDRGGDRFPGCLVVERAGVKNAMVGSWRLE